MKKIGPCIFALVAAVGCIAQPTHAAEPARKAAIQQPIVSEVPAVVETLEEIGMVVASGKISDRYHLSVSWDAGVVGLVVHDSANDSITVANTLYTSFGGNKISSFIELPSTGKKFQMSLSEPNDHGGFTLEFSELDGTNAFRFSVDSNGVIAANADVCKCWGTIKNGTKKACTNKMCDDSDECSTPVGLNCTWKQESGITVVAGLFGLTNAP